MPTHPNPSPVLQFPSERIIKNVLNNPTKFLFVANQMIVVLPLPKRSLPSEELVGLLGCERFPRMNHAGQRIVRKRSHDYMNVIRHQAPGKEPIALSVEVTNCVRDKFGNSWIGEVACALTRVEIALDALGEECSETFPFGRRELAAKMLRRFDNVFAFGGVCPDDGLRNGIGEAEGDEVHATFGFPVRETPAVANSDLAESGARRPRDSAGETPALRR